MRILLLSLFLASSAWGQVFMLNRFPTVGDTAFTPSSISGMMAYWDYQDLSAGNVVAWLDRIQAKDAHQGDATKQPVKDSNGVLFTSDRLTNSTLLRAEAKYSVWIVFKPTATAAGYHALFNSNDGNNGFYHNGTTLLVYTSAGGAFNFATIAANVSYDFVYVNQGTGAAGSGAGYTNTIATATITGSNASGVDYASKGNDDTAAAFAGYIKFIGIWTNTTLTLANITNLYAYSSTH